MPMSGSMHRLTRTRDNTVGGLDRLHPLELPGTVYSMPKTSSGIIRSNHLRRRLAPIFHRQIPEEF